MSAATAQSRERADINSEPKKIPADIGSLCQDIPTKAFAFLRLSCASQSTHPRWQSRQHPARPGWGKPTQGHTADEGSIRVGVRHIVQGHDQPLDAKVIGATPVRGEGSDEG
jgi:hypothetical protein